MYMLLLTGGDLKNSITYIDVTWYTSAISIQPPSCRIKWDAQYLVPKVEDAPYMYSLLPGCFINDSQEGYHVTYYWLHILEWEMDWYFIGLLYGILHATLSTSEQLYIHSWNYMYMYMYMYYLFLESLCNINLYLHVHVYLNIYFLCGHGIIYQMHALYVYIYLFNDTVPLFFASLASPTHNNSSKSSLGTLCAGQCLV